MKSVTLTAREIDFMNSITRAYLGATDNGYVITRKKNKFTDDEQIKLLEKIGC